MTSTVSPTTAPGPSRGAWLLRASIVTMVVVFAIAGVVLRPRLYSTFSLLNSGESATWPCWPKCYIDDLVDELTRSLTFCKVRDRLTGYAGCLR